MRYLLIAIFVVVAVFYLAIVFGLIAGIAEEDAKERELRKQVRESESRLRAKERRLG